MYRFEITSVLANLRYMVAEDVEIVGGKGSVNKDAED